MNTYTDNIGWKNHSANDPKVVELKEYLQRHNGLAGLEVCTTEQIERATSLFFRDGFVVVEDVLSQDQIDQLAEGCDEVIQQVLLLDQDCSGNRGSHRYSFGGSSQTRSMLHHPAWQMLLDVQIVSELLDRIFGLNKYILRAASGDFSIPGAVDYQPLHSDAADWINNQLTPISSFHDPRGKVSIRDLPCPYVCVNFLPQDVTKVNGPTRQIPGSQNSPAPIPSLKEEPEWMRLSTVCPAPAGSIMIRDVRAWHGGTPNVGDAPRSIPNLEFYAPWFREPMVPGISFADFKRLSPSAQRLIRHSVADSSEQLDTRIVKRAPIPERDE
ncbi:MAG: phytanoyl-CoA dioxygenase family protein [Pseudomonadota bacterium]